ncbi:FkbM family methyltransferase [Bradyrhizobium lablabi]|uniref:FkbM family methyltransferase n=1 Tax=Bradyrhizobium lablabi TaxID=722472 RepID=UPI00090BC141|nr:FkbM family methyltransferase [Bradyrhizobium lablabi]SHM85954.1 methyltransferase, FkbM family [Bradyrhizobium lablabi]
MNRSLIFDIGCHIGEDSEFYLKKGFHVVAVEANPALCVILRKRFVKEIIEGRFVLVEKAIAERDGQVEFFVNKASIWGTIRSHMAERNAAAGAESTKISVPSTRFRSLIEQFGMPYYLKVDIEGADHLCLEGLQSFSDRPMYASIEVDQSSVFEMHQSVKLFKQTGYTRFQIVNQGLVPLVRSPNPASEGQYAPHEFPEGATGTFGKELPGEWITETQSRLEFVKIFARNKLDGLSKKAPGLKMLRSRVPGSWYDLHGALPAELENSQYHSPS